MANTVTQANTKGNTQATAMLKIVRQIVDAAGQREAFETAEEFHLNIENAPYMRLVIEAWPVRDTLGASADAHRFISVAHYPERTDPWEDFTCDTDFEMLDDGTPIGLTIAYGTHYTRVRWRDAHDGKVYLAPGARRDVLSFARMWARNIKAQGFLAAAKKIAQTSHASTAPTV